MAERLLRVAGVLVFTPLFFAGILNLLAHILVYHPRPYRAEYRQLLSADVVELPFKTKAGAQISFYLPPHEGSAIPTRLWVVFCGNGSLALDWLPLVRRNTRTGDAFLLIDYPGYGKSKGWPNVANTATAAEGALAALGARVGVPAAAWEARLNLMGHSLGAAAALDFATHHQLAEIILLAPFTSLREEAATFVGPALSHLLLANYDNRGALRELAQRSARPRIMIFHGLQDTLIPARMGRELAAEFPAFVTFRGVPGATHDTIVTEAEDEIVRLMSD